MTRPMTEPESQRTVGDVMHHGEDVSAAIAPPDEPPAHD
jgi:hypothetical protein